MPDGSALPALVSLRPHWREHDRLLWRNYRFRILTYSLSILPLGIWLYEQNANAYYWLLLLFTGVLWPHLAKCYASKGAHPYQRELYNLLGDCFLSGLWVGLIGFSPLLSTLLLMVHIGHKINCGVRNLVWKALPTIATGIALGLLLQGFHLHFSTSHVLLLACLPFLLIHQIAISVKSAQLLHRLNRQNRKLDEMLRTDALTHVASRQQMHGQIRLVLEQLKTAPLPNIAPRNSLILIDVDYFKHVNDSYGHLQGDTVLREVAALLREVFTDARCIGRLGGDEFAVLIGCDANTAFAITQIALQRAQNLQFAEHPTLRCTLSCGISEATAQMQSSKQWIARADEALYRAKRAGRNQVQKI